MNPSVRYEAGSLISSEQYQHALCEKGDFSAAVLDMVGALVVILDNDGRITRFNHTCEIITGYTSAEVTGRIFWEFLVLREELQGVQQTWKALQSGDFPNQHENHWIAKDGSKHLIAWANTAIIGKDGTIAHIIGTGLDITTRKITEDALRFLVECGNKSSDEDFFQLLARYLATSLGMDFVCIDRLQEDLLAAKTVAVYYDGKFEDNISYTLKDTPCADVVDKAVCFFERGVRNLFPKDAVLQEVLAESYAGTILWSSQGQPIGLIAVIGRKPLVDPKLATSVLQLVAVRAAGELERRQAEEALEKAHAEIENEKLRLEAMMEALPTGVAITDLQGGTIRANEEYEHIWAGPRPDTRSVEDYAAYKAWWPETGKPVEPGEWASAIAVREGKAAVGQVLEIQRFDGSRAFVMNSACPIRDADGNITGSAVAIQDITSLRKAESDIRSRVQELKAMNEELARFNRVAVDRELRMVELKKQVNELCIAAGQPAPYPLDFEKGSS